MSTDRDALTSRTLPFMTLSDGSDASLTAPPPPMPHYLNNEGRAVARFAVEGGVVGKPSVPGWPKITHNIDICLL